jgi:ubiquinone/menaquinone biosynthesis C-methylase UbiE
MTDIWSVFAGSSSDGTLDYWDYFGKRLVDLAGIQQGMDILDAGCGCGSSLLPGAEGTGEQGVVVGIDLCPH